MGDQVASVRPPPAPDVFDGSCPSRAVLEHVTGKWAVLVVVALQDGPLRFSVLRRVIGGVSDKMLAQTLRTLDSDGFVHREVAPTTPPQVSYGLTGLGHELTAHLFGLLDWIETSLPAILDARRAGPPRAVAVATRAPSVTS